MAWLGRDLRAHPVPTPRFLSGKKESVGEVLGVKVWREKWNRHRGRGWFSPGPGWALLPVPAVPGT